ncbi:MAG: hypothetical protein ACRD21_15285 [Vicinamibacteria bacterium]
MSETAVTFNKRVARGMRGAYEGEKSGALICQTPDAKRLVFFERGYLVGADDDPERFHLLGKALSENPRWRQDAEQNFKIAHNLKPWEPRYLVSMGKLYEKVGLHQRAQRLYDQVRAMDPDYPIHEDVDVKKSKSDVMEGEVLEDEQAV